MPKYADLIALRDTLYKADAITMEGVKIINQFPAANVAPVQPRRCNYCRGTIFTNKPFKVTTQAGRVVEVQFNYCPNCGAEMEVPGK